MKKISAALAFVLSVSVLVPVTASAMGQESIADAGTTVSVAAYGSSSVNVYVIQKTLAAQGFLKVAPTGYFGPATRAAVIAFQRANGLALVGNVGPKTAALLTNLATSGTTGGTSSSGTSTGTTSGTSTTGTSTGTTTTACAPSTAPWIKVVSPNGGETYHVGDSVTVTWQTCNIPTTDMVNVNLVRANATGGIDHVVTTPDASNQFPVGSGTGSATIAVTATGVWPATIQYGSVYTIMLDVLTPSSRDAGSVVAQDFSDATFAIN